MLIATTEEKEGEEEGEKLVLLPLLLNFDGDEKEIQMAGAKSKVMIKPKTNCLFWELFSQKNVGCLLSFCLPLPTKTLFA